MTESLKELIENKLDFKLEVTTTSHPIKVSDITLVNGVPKKEGAPATDIYFNRRLSLRHKLLT